MSAREFAPARLDVEAFANQGAELAGRDPVSRLDRLASSLASEDGAPEVATEVEWRARGERRVLRGEAQVWLHLEAHAKLPLECQRCLMPVIVAVDVERSLRFVHGEDAAAQIDADSEDDVLALTRALDLHGLIEDELMLALPLVPRHEHCPEPLTAAVAMDDVDADGGKPNPFAALAALKGRGLLN
ncbi:MAG: YceD family protein [Burkholderiaceae bacterium]